MQMLKVEREYDMLDYNPGELSLDSQTKQL
jgi:hypothetical protein